MRQVAKSTVCLVGVLVLRVLFSLSILAIGLYAVHHHLLRDWFVATFFLLWRIYSQKLNKMLEARGDFKYRGVIAVHPVTYQPFGACSQFIIDV